MSESGVVKVKSRLADQIEKPGGMTAKLAMERVGRELTAAEGKSREVVGESLVLLEDLCRNQTVSMDAVYDAATAVIDVAGLFDERILCDAAYSLCELTDRLRTQDKVDWASVIVHVEALRLIYNAEPSETQQYRLVVDGLWRVTELYKERPLD
ncbi:MAG TPA: chemotaxis protein CheE [Phenylobacterium sp.]